LLGGSFTDFGLEAFEIWFRSLGRRHGEEERNENEKVNDWRRASGFV
jgi:hypothetical protein